MPGRATDRGSPRLHFRADLRNQREECPDDRDPSDRGVAPASRPEADRSRGAYRTRCCLRRYRHQHALWAKAGHRGGRSAHPRHSNGHRVADPLVAPPDRRAQIRNSDPARRQSRRGRHRGPAGAARCKARTTRELACLPAHRRFDRGCAALWGRRDHAGDLGTQRYRRSQDRRTRTRAHGRSYHHRNPG